MPSEPVEVTNDLFYNDEPPPAKADWDDEDLAPEGRSIYSVSKLSLAETNGKDHTYDALVLQCMLNDWPEGRGRPPCVWVRIPMYKSGEPSWCGKYRRVVLTQLELVAKYDSKAYAGFNWSHLLDTYLEIDVVHEEYKGKLSAKSKDFFNPVQVAPGKPQRPTKEEQDAAQGRTDDQQALADFGLDNADDDDI